MASASIRFWWNRTNPSQQSDPALRAAMKWYHKIDRQVWPYEIRNFIFRDHRCQNGPTLAEFWSHGKATRERADLSTLRQPSAGRHLPQPLGSILEESARTLSATTAWARGAGGWPRCS
jgi:hypothetical protein